MEKEVVTTQTIDLKTAKKAIKAASLRLQPYVIYIVIFCIFFAVNFSQIFFSNSNDTTNESAAHERAPAVRDSVIAWSEILVSLIPFFILIIVYIFIKRFVKNGGIKEQFEKKTRYFTNVTYTVNSNFLKVQGDGFESTNYWEEMHKVKETKEFYVIFSEKLRAHIIDKAQLDPWQTEEIKEIFSGLKSKIKVSLK
jgi:heme/copper-type cytochrome/quinol oxidase subunit 2